MKEDFPMRINKYLALKGYATRRGADELIQKRQVLINGRFAELGDQVEENDAVEVRKNNRPAEHVYYAYNKPAGVDTLASRETKKDIKSSVNLKGVFPIGRLDKNSEGLIILTNDGRITDRLLNPKYAHDKEYIVKTKEKLRNNFKEKMEQGVNIEGYITQPAKVKIINDHTFSVSLSEGKTHQIRRMVVALFNEVESLKRMRIMNINLGKLAPNSYRKIEGEELDIFLKGLGLR